VKYLKDDLSDHLRVRLEHVPYQLADTKYMSKFLTLDAMVQFNVSSELPGQRDQVIHSKNKVTLIQKWNLLWLLQLGYDGKIV